MAEKQKSNRERLEAKSADYEAMIGYWNKASDIISGLEAITKAGKKYLPRFPDEIDKEFDYRLSLAKFTNVFRDMVEGLASKPFEQEVMLTGDNNPQQIKTFIEDVDGSGNNISVFAMATFFDGIPMAIDWIFVDYPPNDSEVVRSKAEEDALGLRPFWSHVTCKNVYEVQTQIVNGVEQISYIRIFEPEHGSTPNQFREMQKTDQGANYTIWTWSVEAEDYVQTAAGPITIGFVPMVPFITGRRNGRSWQFYPPMKDAADLQIDLYQAESNLKYTKTCAAFPMLVAEGIKQASGKDGVPERLVVGPGAVLYAPSNGAGVNGTWKYLEPNGQSLTFLSTDIKDITAQLRELGRQPLTVSSGNLTTITTAVAAGKSKSAVKTWGIGLTDALTLALYYTALYYNLGGYEPSVKVYDEYDDLLEPGADVASLISLAGQSKISMETLWEELKRRKLLSNEFTADRERTRLLEDVPNGTTDPNQPERF